MVIRWLAVASLAQLVASGCSSATDSITQPIPKVGTQLRIPPFRVPQGTEIQQCYFFKNPSAVDLDVVRIRAKMALGSHHVNLYQTEQDYPDHVESCFALTNIVGPQNPGGLSLIFNAARPDVDWNLPEGVGFHLRAKQQLVMQVHYVNASTQTTPGDAEVVWNLYGEPDPSKITSSLGVLFAANTKIDVLPYSHSQFDADCRIPVDRHLLAASGHFHSRGTEFDIFASDSSGTFPSAPLYVSKDWAESPFEVYQPPIDLGTGSLLRFRCIYDNTTPNEYIFGPHVDTQEHCIAIFYLYPYDSALKQDFCEP